MTTTIPEPSSETAAGGGEQFVTFSVCDELFGVRLTEVQEIIRVPALIHVPLAPASLEGIANLRGTVLPVTNLRRVFHADAVGHDDATRVVVVNRGGLMGFVVDRMASVITAEPGQIEAVAGIQSIVEADLLSGVIKRKDGMVLLLDLGMLTGLGSGRSGDVGAATSPADPKPQASAGGNAPSSPDVAADEMQLVSFEVAGEEYAFPIEEVLEIVQMPDRIIQVPRAAGHVVGVITLRDQLLPLVSLREMFGMPAAPEDGPSRIVVVSPDGGLRQSGWIGVVMDTVNEVLRVSRAFVDPVPPILAERGAELTSICRLDGGKRLVTILSAPRMFEGVDLGVLTGAAEDVSMDHAATTDAAARTRDEEEEQFVVFRLAKEEYGVPIAAVQEIVRVPDDLTALPLAPSFIEGVVNLRGMVLPVVDQRRRFNLPDVDRSDRQRIMVLTLGDARAGFVVDQVTEVLKIRRSQIETAPEVTPGRGNVIRRVANLQDCRRMILLLEPDALLDEARVPGVDAAA